MTRRVIRVSLACVAVALSVGSSVAIAEWASGDTAPIRVLEGPSTEIGEAAGIAFDSEGRMYVANYLPTSHISVYPANWADGDTAPIKVLSGPSTELGLLRSLAFDSSGRMYVTDYSEDEVLVFAADWADGDTAPLKVLSGASTGLDWPYGVAFDDSGRMYVTNRMGNSVTVYAANWADGPGGDIAPIKSLAGASTGLDGPQILAFDSDDRMFVTNNSFPPKVTAYTADWADGPGGDLAPFKTLVGSDTELASPHGIAFDSEDRMYVVNTGSEFVTVYGNDWPDGNTSPAKILGGPATRIDAPWEVALDESDRLYVGGRTSVNVYGDVRRRRGRPQLRYVNLDPAGGNCFASVDHDQPWSESFRRFRFIPGPEECSRAGFVFLGWADADLAEGALALPLLVDPTDGTKRFLVSEDAILIARWAPRPSRPEVFAGTRRFFCRDCGVWLVWDRPLDASVVTVSDSNGDLVCESVVDADRWQFCHIPSGRAGSYTLLASNQWAVSDPLVTMVE